MSSNQEISQRKNAAVSSGVGMMTQIYAKRARNAEIWDVEDQRYIDFASGIAVLNTGHCHPKVIAAVQTQLEAFTHTCHQVVPYESYVALAERLNALTPGDFAKKTCFVSTGAEALENAVKIARAATRRDAVIAFSGGFHGRTFMGMALTGKTAPYKIGFGHMPADVYHAPYPVALHGISVQEALNGIERLFKSDVDPSRVAAIVFEPVQGEGGFYVAPPEFVRGIRQICDQHGIVMIADEVQTGFARTGKCFAMEHYDVAPDLTTMAKSLAGGFPLAAVVGRAELLDAPAPGGLGGTYAGSPIGVAAAHAVLDVIEEEGLCARADVLGRKLCGRLEALQREYACIADIRGLGFMNAIEFMTPEGQPDADLAQRVRLQALERKLILLTCGVHGNVIRFLAPITIEDAVFEEAMQILEASVRAAA